MLELAQENLRKAQKTQKRWYDQNAREREFKVGEKVLVLLPTSSNKLLAKWHGPYPVLNRVGTVTYQVDMFDHAKRKRIFHVNMLRKWQAPGTTNLFVDIEDPDTTANELEPWNNEDDKTGANISERLSMEQHGQLKQLVG